jgi:hypothetical protein
MKPEGSSPYTQEPATCPYPEPDQSSPGPPPNLSKIHLNIRNPITLLTQILNLNLLYWVIIIIIIIIIIITTIIIIIIDIIHVHSK